MHYLDNISVQAIVGLLQAGKVSYVCSQNVDSLHLRSGMPRQLMAELHGNCFAERCEACQREYLRDFQVRVCVCGGGACACACATFAAICAIRKLEN